MTTHPDTGVPRVAAGRTSTLLRRAGRVFARGLGFGLFLGVLLVMWPVSWGGQMGYTVVSGHSMEPGMHTGDLVLTWRTDDYRPGEVITYFVPDGQPGAGAGVVHRIVAGDPQTGFTTQGDNRNGPDIWTPRTDDIAHSTSTTTRPQHFMTTPG